MDLPKEYQNVGVTFFIEKYTSYDLLLVSVLGKV